MTHTNKSPCNIGLAKFFMVEDGLVVVSWQDYWLVNDALKDMFPSVCHVIARRDAVMADLNIFLVNLVGI